MNNKVPSPERSVLVTGANGILGSAIARAFLENTATTRTWLGINQGTDRARQLIDTFPGRAEMVNLDVRNTDSWRDAVGRVTANGGPLDILVNNAGGHEDALLGAMTGDTWSRVMDLNLNGVFHGCKTVLPHMIARRFGRIVNIASLSALTAPAGQTNYAAAKAGVLALSQSLSKEVARLNITVNSVCPGFIEPGPVQFDTDQQKREWVRRIPMRRMGSPAEVASAVVFLAGDSAAYITGAVLKIDGGLF